MLWLQQTNASMELPTKGIHPVSEGSYLVCIQCFFVVVFFVLFFVFCFAGPLGEEIPPKVLIPHNNKFCLFFGCFSHILSPQNQFPHPHTTQFIQRSSSYSNVDTAKASQMMKLFLTITLQSLKNAALFQVFIQYCGVQLPNF